MSVLSYGDYIYRDVTLPYFTLSYGEIKRPNMCMCVRVCVLTWVLDMTFLFANCYAPCFD
jgi:hypothetical protein